MQLTWLGHAAFRLDFSGKAVLIDPFFTGNPAFTLDRREVIADVSHILLTHGHSDHVGDTVEIAKATGASVVANYDLGVWLQSQGVEKLNPLNTGGTVDAGGFSVTLVRADHSAGLADMGVIQPVGPAGGLIVKAPGEPVLYHMGDTDIFSDMGLIQELHRPEIGLVPIGDRFTMGPEVAALAVKRFFQFKTVIPAHYGSFPPLVQSPDSFVAALQGGATKVVAPRVGERIEL